MPVSQFCEALFGPAEETRLLIGSEGTLDLDCTQILNIQAGCSLLKSNTSVVTTVFC